MKYDFWEGIVRDLTEAGKIRLILQPLMAISLGVGLIRARGQFDHAAICIRDDLSNSAELS